jgi:hypothetical protein
MAQLEKMIAITKTKLDIAASIAKKRALPSFFIAGNCVRTRRHMLQAENIAIKPVAPQATLITVSISGKDFHCGMERGSWYE